MEETSWCCVYVCDCVCVAYDIKRNVCISQRILFLFLKNLTFSFLLFPFQLVDVPGWLKTLRLHKYQSLFADMSYEDLLATTEEFLESKVCVEHT